MGSGLSIISAGREADVAGLILHRAPAYTGLTIAHFFSIMSSSVSRSLKFGCHLKTLLEIIIRVTLNLKR